MEFSFRFTSFVSMVSQISGCRVELLNDAIPRNGKRPTHLRSFSYSFTRTGQASNFPGLSEQIRLLSSRKHLLVRDGLKRVRKNLNCGAKSGPHKAAVSWVPPGAPRLHPSRNIPITKSISRLQSITFSLTATSLSLDRLTPYIGIRMSVFYCV